METWQRGCERQMAQATPSAQRPCPHRWVSQGLEMPSAPPLPRLFQVSPTVLELQSGWGAHRRVILFIPGLAGGEFYLKP